MILKKRYSLLLISAIFLALFAISCSEDTQIPDVSDIPVEINMNRFEKALFSLDTLQLDQSIGKLKEQYPAFSTLYFTRILPLDKPVEGNNFAKNVNDFINYPTVRQLYDTTQLVFNDITPIQVELKQAFQFYKHYFPNQNIPAFYTFLSEYSYQTFIFDDSGNDAVGIGLDMFLGADYPYRKYIPDNPSFSAYLTRAFDKKHLTKKVMDVVIDDLVGTVKGKKLLDEMVHNGKRMYILDKILPTTPDSIKWEYTAAQIDWCRKNELQLWTYFLGEDLLYSTERKKIRKLVDPSPTGPSDIPPEAPGRTANWIGWKIVQSYMLRNPTISLSDLIAETDAQMIMDKARYRPK